MRRALSIVMIAILAFLVVILVIATKQKESPKAVLQGWFHKSVTTGDNNTGTITTTELTGTTTGNLDGSTTGSLSDEDKENTQNLIDSLIQQP